jgi:UDP-N-acetylglucosamine:LPS N-acetylglucosamine transferase
MPLPKCKILILTSMTGGGHVSIAKAIQEMLPSHCHVEIADPQPKFLIKHYEIIGRRALWLWAVEYRLTNYRIGSALMHRLFYRLIRKKLRLLLESQPDLIISTYAFYNDEVAKLQQELGISVPFIKIFTDPVAVHASWLRKTPDAYTLAPTHETYDQAIEAGFSTDRLIQTGWPVRRQFLDASQNKSVSVKTLVDIGLDPYKLTIFIQGGGQGATGLGPMIDQLLLNPKVQIILAVGTNTQLQKRYTNTISSMYVVPFTPDIAKYMQAADVVMGKAGPNILFEAVTLRKPFIATSYIPGQEEPNLRFIVKHKLGWIALKLSEQERVISSILNSAALLAEYRRSVDNYRSWNVTALANITSITTTLLQAKPGGDN